MSDLASAAVAAMLAAASAALFTDARPPVRFQDDAVFLVEVRDQRGINAECQLLFGVPPEGMKTDACTIDGRVIAPNPCDYSLTETYARMLCHEMGHVNGWPPVHGQ
jgi:hypothetical protein